MPDIALTTLFNMWATDDAISERKKKQAWKMFEMGEKKHRWNNSELCAQRRQKL